MNLKFSKKFISVCLIFVFTVSGFLTSTTLAADVPQNQNSSGIRLTISPYSALLATEPGKSASLEVKIRNDGTFDERLKVGVLKFNAYGDEGKPRLIDPEPGDEFLKWVSFSESAFDISPNEWKTIILTFNVPEYAAFGYYYAITFSREEDIKLEEPRNTVAFHGSSALLVLLEVKSPNAKREIEVLDFSTNKKFYEYLPVSFQMKLRNKGNVHVAPHGSIFIDKGEEKDLALLSINKEKGNLLPDSNRIFATSWTDGFPTYILKEEGGKVVFDKGGKQVYKLKWDFTKVNKLRFGKYTATMLLIYDDGQRDVPVEAVTYFWVVPWRLITVSLIVIGLITLGIVSILKGFWRGIINKRNHIKS